MIPALRTRHSRHKRSSRDVVFFALSIALLCIIGVGIVFVLPRLDKGTFRIASGSDQPFTFPLHIADERPQDIDVTFTLSTGFIRPSHYHFLPDDCINEITVNHQKVDDPQIPFCDYAKGRVFDLGKYLSSGNNDVSLKLHNDGGSGSLLVEAAPDDPLVTGLFAAMLLVGAAAGYFLLRMLKVERAAYALYAIFILGVALRAFYLLVTPHWIRGHDTDGHIEYMQYLSNHWSLPTPGEGWEYWQPPAYYILGALVIRTASLFGFSLGDALHDVQVMSFGLSVGSLLISIWIARMLFPAREQNSALSRILFVLSQAVFSGLIFFSARINNDVSAAFFSYLLFALLLRWWMTGKTDTIVLAFFFAALGILSKSTGLLWLPILGACLLLRRKTPWKKKLVALGLSAGVFIVMTAPYVAARFSQLREGGLVGNAQNLSSGLAVTDSFAAMTTFNPLEIVKHPYNSPWSDEQRRQFFPEYLFRSAFTGEFDFGTERRIVVQSMIIVSFPLLLLAVSGIALALVEEPLKEAPLLLTFFVLLLGHAIFRWRFPFSASQDFRYSPLLLIPLFAYAIRTFQRLPKPFRAGALLCFEAFFLLSCIFILSL